MAIGNFLLGQARKKLGDIVFYRRLGEQVARVRVRHIANPRSEGQAAQRSRLKALLPLFRLLDGALYQRIKPGWSQYNAFFSRNFKGIRPLKTGQVTLNYGISYPKIVPPTPKDGLGQGLSVHMPVIVTEGSLQEPVFGVGPNNADPDTISPFCNNLASVQAGGTLSNWPVFYLSMLNPAAVGSYLISMGYNTITTDSVSSAVVKLPDMLKALSFAITGSDRNHLGFLLVYATQFDSVSSKAVYNELTGAPDLDVLTSFTNGELSGFGSNFSNSRGEGFILSFGSKDDYVNFGDCLLVQLKTETANYNLPTASAVIVSRKTGNTLDVSTSTLQLDDDAASFYEALFTGEIYAKAVDDYQSQASDSNGYNLDLK